MYYWRIRTSLKEKEEKGGWITNEKIVSAKNKFENT
jgi:hypothetical protein